MRSCTPTVVVVTHALFVRRCESQTKTRFVGFPFLLIGLIQMLVTITIIDWLNALIF
jgi:hypothetical protein